MSNRDPLINVVSEFAKMPGIGQKSAQRLAFYLLSLTKEEVDDFVAAVAGLKESVGFCKTCYHLTYKHDYCNVCESLHRNKNQICVVSESKDLIALEKMNKFNGLYHVLGGVISPLNGIGPEQLRVRELLERLKTEEIEEIIFALSPSIEGETTTLYLKKLLQPLGVKLTQIAYGIPLGSDLEWADELTLSRAFEGRNVI